jgi:hypothetical protein
VVNPSNGTPIGVLFTGSCCVTTQGLTVPDSTLGRVFILSEQSTGSPSTVEIQLYDQTHFTWLGSLTVPNVSGKPTHFIRWGRAGLAFLTSASVGSTAPGQLYLLNGPFVNPTDPPDSTVGTTINGTPVLSSIAPSNATAGGGGASLILSGTGFASNSVAEWNGVALDTTYISATQLQATVPASDIANPGSAAVTVTTLTPGAGTSNASLFSVLPPAPAGIRLQQLELPGNDLAWNPQQGTIYVSVPGTNGVNGNIIAEINPETGAIVRTQFAGSEPNLLTISTDDQYLYAGLNGSSSIQRFSLPALTPDTNWSLPSDDLYDDEPVIADALEVAPGLAHIGVFITFVSACPCIVPVGRIGKGRK